MTLSSVLVGALKSFNEKDPMTRVGTLPITDGASFLSRNISSPPDKSAHLGRNSVRKEADPSSDAEREFVERAGDSIQNGKLNPYVFAPPGMDIN